MPFARNTGLSSGTQPKLDYLKFGTEKYQIFQSRLPPVPKNPSQWRSKRWQYLTLGLVLLGMVAVVVGPVVWWNTDIRDGVGGDPDVVSRSRSVPDAVHDHVGPCNPNPCQHGGICALTNSTFSCDCDGTEYDGAVCHTSYHPASCVEALMLHSPLAGKRLTIDFDSSGPLKPILVNCILQNESVITEVRHESMRPTFVNGFQGAGSYSRAIIYEAGIEELEEIVSRASECEQYIKYRCYQSRLLSDAGNPDPDAPSWGWWVSRGNQTRRYWGGAAPGSGQCACAVRNECMRSGVGPSDNPCNCDAGLAMDDVFDDGFLTHKDHLPVMELRFGDTGTVGDQKFGEHTLGPLRCKGDSVFENAVPFYNEGVTIEISSFTAAPPIDVRFQFKTSHERGSLLQLYNSERVHFIEAKLLVGRTLHVSFDFGGGKQTMEKTSAYPLNDGQWHTVLIERNMKQTTLRVDLQAPVALDDDIHHPSQTNGGNAPLVVEAAVDRGDALVDRHDAPVDRGEAPVDRGEAPVGRGDAPVGRGDAPVGCVRGMMISGRWVDITYRTRRGDLSNGVSPDGMFCQ